MPYKALREEVSDLVRKLREWQSELAGMKDPAGAKALAAKIHDFEVHTISYYGIGKHIKDSWS